MTDALLGIADTYPAAELLHVADQVERAKEIGEYVRDQYYRVEVYDPRWKAMIEQALRHLAGATNARAQCSPGTEPLRHDDPIFKCRVCGVLCPIAPPEGGAVCEAHCEDHEYEYERGEGHRCKHCFAEPPRDWFSCEDDVI